MAKQSELERLGIEERQDELIHSPYKYNETTPYNDSHPDALADGDAKGKGTAHPSTFLSIPTTKDTNAPIGSTVDTENGGNIYDTDGTEGVQGAFQGNAGRKYLSLGGINAYNPNNEYGAGSIDTSVNQAEGQYVVK